MKTNFKDKIEQSKFNPKYRFVMNINERIKGMYNRIMTTLQSMFYGLQSKHINMYKYNVQSFQTLSTSIFYSIMLA